MYFVPAGPLQVQYIRRRSAARVLKALLVVL